MPVVPEYIAALGVGVASGLVPVVNVEAYLLGLLLLTGGEPSWSPAVCAGIGQVLGKLVYFYAGRGSLRLPGFLRRRLKLPDGDALADGDAAPDGDAGHGDTRASTRTDRRTRAFRRGAVTAAIARWSTRTLRRAERWRARAEQRPRWYVAVLGVSALTGLPPFGIMSAVAGGIRLRLATYLLIGVPARCARFTLLVFAPGAVTGVLGSLGLI